MDANDTVQKSVSALFRLNAARSVLDLEYLKIQRDMDRIVQIRKDYDIPLDDVIAQLNEMMILRQNQMHDIDGQLKMFALACDAAKKTLEQLDDYQVKLGRVTYPNVAARSKILAEYRE